MPLDAHAATGVDSDRDPIGLLMGQAESRVPELVPVRHARMAVSPFTYFRGAALPMAADLARAPRSDLTVQLCGDAHLANFGAFASPERRLVFDCNDFDETLPGPFEWDVKRLAASLAVAARDNGFKRKERKQIVRAGAEAYRKNIRNSPTRAGWRSGTPTSTSRRPSRASATRSGRRRTARRPRCWPRRAARTAGRRWRS